MEAIRIIYNLHSNRQKLKLDLEDQLIIDLSNSRKA